MCLLSVLVIRLSLGDKTPALEQSESYSSTRRIKFQTHLANNCCLYAMADWPGCSRWSFLLALSNICRPNIRHSQAWVFKWTFCHLSLLVAHSATLYSMLYVYLSVYHVTHFSLYLSKRFKGLQYAQRSASYWPCFIKWVPVKLINISCKKY